MDSGSRLCNAKRLAGPQDDVLRNVRLRYVQLSSTSNCGLSIFDGDRPCSLRKDVSLCCPAASGADGSCRLAEGAMVGHRMACQIERASCRDSVCQYV